MDVGDARDQAPDDDKHVDLRADRPTASELLEIIAETLTTTVLPATAPHAQHQVRVAANLCRILERELMAKPVGAATVPETVLELDDEEAAAIFAQVKGLVQAKLAINKPGYDAHDAAAENAVVA